MWDTADRACGPVDVRSPKSNVYVAMGLEPGLEVEASTATASGAAPPAGKTASDAFGGATIATEVVAVPDAATLSLTVTVTEKTPAAV